MSTFNHNLHYDKYLNIKCNAIRLLYSDILCQTCLDEKQT